MLSNIENLDLERVVAIAEQNEGELILVSSTEDSQMRLYENRSNTQAETYTEPETETLVEDLWLVKEDVDVQTPTISSPEFITAGSSPTMLRSNIVGELQSTLPNVEEVWSEPEPLGVGKRRNSVDVVEGVCNGKDVNENVGDQIKGTPADGSTKYSITEEVLVDVVLRDSKSKSGDYSNLLDNLIDSTAESTRPNIFNKIKKWFCIGFSTSFIGCARTK